MGETLLDNMLNSISQKFNAIKNPVLSLAKKDIDSLAKKNEKSFDDYLSNTQSKNQDSKTVVTNDNKSKTSPLKDTSRKTESPFEQTGQSDNNDTQKKEESVSSTENTEQDTDNTAINNSTIIPLEETEQEHTSIEDDEITAQIPLSQLINIPINKQDHDIVTGLDTELLEDTAIDLTNIDLSAKNNLGDVNEEMIKEFPSLALKNTLIQESKDFSLEEIDISKEATEDIMLEEFLSEEITPPQNMDLTKNNNQNSDLLNLVQNLNPAQSEQINNIQDQNIISALHQHHNHNHNIQKQNIIFTQTPQTVGTIPLGDQLSLQIVKSNDNPNQIGINLEPAGMGEVELIIENNKDNAVIAIIRSDKPEILENIRKEAASLEKYLSEAGLDLAGGSLSFEHKNNDNNSEKNPNNANTSNILSAQIGEERVTGRNHQLLSQQEQLYLKLDQQSVDNGLDIRL